MRYPFDARRGLVVVEAEVAGPSGTGVLRLALGTGATGTLINADMLVAVGYDPATAPSRKRITTGSGVEFAAQIVVQRVSALGKEQLAFPILCHTLPPSAGVDGLLGLDFVRGSTLTIDFETGLISLR